MNYMLENLSQFSIEKMKELVGQEIHYGDETVKVTDVREDANVFGDVMGYVIYTNNGSKYNDFHWYPGTAPDRDTKLVLPDEYMEDICQASEIQKKLEADNETRLKELRKQTVPEREKGSIRVFIETNYSFHYGASLSVTVYVQTGAGCILLPINRVENKLIEMSDEQIVEFFRVYKDFDFFEDHKEKRQGFDGWTLRYTACAGVTYFQHSLWCPEPGDAVWNLVEYALMLSKEYLPTESYEERFSLLQEYCNKLQNESIS